MWRFFILRAHPCPSNYALTAQIPICLSRIQALGAAARREVKTEIATPFTIFSPCSAASTSPVATGNGTLPSMQANSSFL
ncbi:hypothetical protein CC2G_009857 [Coprinopsis cinerea AmutBmut pab1-1]|nr:hypothetical protein CC2G_009857 [Coprinopsis cinerea AmutBmut pab1-1]